MTTETNFGHMQQDVTLSNFTPRSDYHLVRFTEPETISAGGIHLPETAQKNYTECEVLKSGPGYLAGDTEIRSPMWARPGDIVVIEKHSFQPIVGSKKGLIQDEDIIGVLDEDGDIIPLNDWVKVAVPEKPEKIGNIYLPETEQQKLNEGQVLGYGPGKLRKTGRLSGTRASCYGIMGVGSNETLLGETVFWTERATILEMGRETVSCLFLRAGDIDGRKVPETGKT